MRFEMIKKVPKSATGSTATLDCPSGFTDELPSSWYNYVSISNYINLTNRVKRPVNPTNRIIAKQARDSSGSKPYIVHNQNLYLNLTISENKGGYQ